MAKARSIFTSEWIDILLAADGYTNPKQISDLSWVETPGPGRQEFTVEIKFQFKDAVTGEHSDRVLTVLQTYRTV